MLKFQYEKDKHLNQRMDTGRNRHFTKKKMSGSKALEQTNLISNREMQIKTTVKYLINRQVYKNMMIPSVMKDVK